jgi:hypothetical protein
LCINILGANILIISTYTVASIIIKITLLPRFRKNRTEKYETTNTCVRLPDYFTFEHRCQAMNAV